MKNKNTIPAITDFFQAKAHNIKSLYLFFRRSIVRSINPGLSSSLFLTFKKNLFLDSDILWCKNPDNLWKQFNAYQFTITGNQTSDLFFGAPKGFPVLKDFLLRRRKRTLKRFNLTYLSRVQSGMIYAADYDLTKEVCELAKEMLSRREETHFRSRKEEVGRSEESCEWSFAMAMAKLIPKFGLA